MVGLIVLAVIGVIADAIFSFCDETNGKRTENSYDEKPDDSERKKDWVGDIIFFIVGGS